MTSAENGGLGDDGNAIPSSENGLKTYSRRKRAKVVKDDGKVALASTSQSADKAMEEPVRKASHQSSRTQVSSSRMELQASSVHDRSERSRIFVLEQLQLLETEGCLQGCSGDAHHLKGCMRNAIKKSAQDGTKCTSKTSLELNAMQDVVDVDADVPPNGSMHESNGLTVTELCEREFSHVITSEKFAELRRLVIKSFPGVDAEKVFDVSLIKSRMKEGAYESSADLFRTDIQQVWKGIQDIGTEMVALAKSLADESTTPYHEEVGSHSSFGVENHEFLTEESEMQEKADHEEEACDLYKICTCKHCGENAEGKHCLVCDSCEEMYHISCIELVEEIPSESWYCASCNADGIGSPHECCLVCERLNGPTTPDLGGVRHESNEETVTESDEGSNGLADDELPQTFTGGESLPICNVCKSEVEDGEEKEICEHYLCPHKFYHARCLMTRKETGLVACWYCPSCQCRSCLADHDYDKIVLCDGCHDAYHIYCLQPPRDSIPQGKWFCTTCDDDIRRIVVAKMEYESSKAADGKGKQIDQGVPA